MYCQVYLRKGIVYLPTLGRMDKGFYRGVEPVAVVSASNTDALRDALAAMMARGNPDVPMLRRRDWPPPVLLRYAGAKSWSAFQRGMLLWGIEEKDGTFHIIGKRRKEDGTIVDDPAQIITFTPESKSNDVIERMISIVQHSARKQ